MQHRRTHMLPHNSKPRSRRTHHSPRKATRHCCILAAPGSELNYVPVSFDFDYGGPLRRSCVFTAGTATHTRPWRHQPERCAEAPAAGVSLRETNSTLTMSDMEPWLGPVTSLLAGEAKPRFWSGFASVHTPAHMGITRRIWVVCARVYWCQPCVELCMIFRDCEQAVRATARTGARTIGVSGYL